MVVAGGDVEERIADKTTEPIQKSGVPAWRND